MKTLKNKAKKLVKNTLEKNNEIGDDYASGTTDSLQSLLNWEEVLGLKSKTKKGTLEPGKAVYLGKPHENNSEAEEKKSVAEAAIDYSREILHTGERAISRGNKEMETQLREIMAEIKKLADSSKELQQQFRGIAVEQYVAAPGEYHKNFFSWLLSVVRAARAKIEDSSAWLSALHNKKDAQKYGAMAKKHGSSFTLNNERTVATQVG